MSKANRVLILLLSTLVLTQEASTPTMELGPVKYRGQASWYGKVCDSEEEWNARLCGEEGRKTYCGDTFRRHARTVAVPAAFGIECGRKVVVTRVDTGASITVDATDRLPDRWRHVGRIADLSYGAARDIEAIRAGLVEIELEVLPQ